MDLGELVARLTLDTSKFTASASAANVSIAQMGRSLDAIGAKKVQGVIDAMNGSIMEANKRQTAFNAAVLKNVKAIEAARLQADAYREAQVRLGLTAQEKLNTVSDSFKKVTASVGALGITAGGTFGKMVDGAAGLASAITGGGAIGVAGGLVGVFGLVAGAISVAKDRMDEFRRTAEEAAAAVDKQFSQIKDLAEGAVGGGRFATMSSKDLEVERQKLGTQAAASAAAARNLLEQANMKRGEAQALMKRMGSGSDVMNASSAEIEGLMLQAEGLAQKAANLRKQMLEIRTTETSKDGFFGAALRREAGSEDALKKRREETEAWLRLTTGGTEAASQFNTELDALNNALAFAGGPLTQVATATQLLGEAASAAALSMQAEADAFARGPGTGDPDAPAAGGPGDARWLASVMGGPLGALGALLPSDRFLQLNDGLIKSGEAAERAAKAHKEVADILAKTGNAAYGSQGLQALMGLAGMGPGQLVSSLPGVMDAMKKDKTARGVASQLGSLAGPRGAEVMGTASSIMGAVGPALPVVGQLLQGLADRFTQVMGEAVDYVGKLFQGVFDAVSAPAMDVLGKAFQGNAALGALGGGAQQGMAAGGTAVSLALAPMLAGIAGGPTTTLATLIIAPLVLPLVAAFAPLVAASVGAGAGLMELATQTKSYQRWQDQLTRSTQPLVDAMEPLWRNLLPLTQQFLLVNRALGAVIGGLLPGQDMARQLYEMNRQMALGAINVAIGLGNAHNAVNAVTRKFIEVHNTLDKMFNRGRDQKDAGGIHDTDVQALMGLRGAVEGASYAADMAAAELDNLSRAARESMNIPVVAKVSAARYAAMLEAESRAAGGGAPVMGGNMAPAWGASGPGGGHTTINGDVHVHGADVESAMAKLKRGEWHRKQTSPTDGWTPGRYANRG